jgi:hypothetical protein
MKRTLTSADLKIIRDAIGSEKYPVWLRQTVIRLIDEIEATPSVDY